MVERRLARRTVCDPDERSELKEEGDPKGHVRTKVRLDLVLVVLVLEAERQGTLVR